MCKQDLRIIRLLLIGVCGGEGGWDYPSPPPPHTHNNDSLVIFLNSGDRHMIYYMGIMMNIHWTLVVYTMTPSTRLGSGGGGCLDKVHL